MTSSPHHSPSSCLKRNKEKNSLIKYAKNNDHMLKCPSQNKHVTKKKDEIGVEKWGTTNAIGRYSGRN